MTTEKCNACKKLEDKLKEIEMKISMAFQIHESTLSGKSKERFDTLLEIREMIKKVLTQS